MSNYKRFARERLEIYLVHIILMYRRFIMVIGLLLLVYAIASMFVNLLSGEVILIPAVFLLVLSSSFNIALYTARLGTWIGTLWRNDE